MDGAHTHVAAIEKAVNTHDAERSATKNSDLVCSLFRSNAMMPTIARKYPIISINPSVLLKISMSFFEMLDLLVRANILIKRTC